MFFPTSPFLCFSFNRFFFICYHDSYFKVFRRRVVAALTVFVWIESCALALPNLVGWNHFEFDRKKLSCMWSRRGFYSYTVFFTVTGVFIPVAFTAVCYLKIFLFVRKSTKRIGCSNEAIHSKAQKRSRRLAKTLFCIFILFVSTWSPYALTVLYDRFDRASPAQYLYVTMFAHTHASLSCIVYGATNVDFRRSYANVLLRIAGFVTRSQINLSHSTQEGTAVRDHTTHAASEMHASCKTTPKTSRTEPPKHPGTCTSEV